MNRIILENNNIFAEIIPELGGKVSSLIDKSTGFQALFQNPKGEYRIRKHGDLFKDHDASGFDDAFPNIDASVLDVGNKHVEFPDHGEIWTTPLEYHSEGKQVVLNGNGTVLDYKYQKSIELLERGIRISYSIVNNESFDIPCLWTMHCLLNCYAGCRIELPSSSGKVLNLCDSTVIGAAGEMVLEQHPELTQVPVQGPDTMFNYYLTEPVQTGHCSVVYPKEAVRCCVNWDKEKLPYLGIWCTMGGYRGDCNLATEPSTGYYDDVGRAMQNKRLKMLTCGEVFEFSVSMTFEKYHE